MRIVYGHQTAFEMVCYDREGIALRQLCWPVTIQRILMAMRLAY